VFAPRVNREMVDLEAPDGGDREWLRRLIGRHMENTGSTAAERILADWPAAACRFVKVMPRDYKRVLQAQAEAERTGTDAEAAIMASAHG